MLQLLKRNTNASASAASPAWHPNFRNYAELPDTKVVRTTFFLNSAAVLVATILLLVVGYQEYQRATINQQIDDAKARIDRDKPVSDKAVALYRQFQQEEAKITEISDFLKRSKMVFSDFVLRIGNTLPRNVAIVLIEYRDSGVALKGRVTGSSEEATGLASTYEKQLRSDPEFSTKFQSINMLSLTPDTEKGTWIFFIELKFPSAQGGKK